MPDIILTAMKAEYHAARNALGLRETVPCPGAVRSAEGCRRLLVQTGGGEWRTGLVLGALLQEWKRELGGLDGVTVWDTGAAAGISDSLEPGQIVQGAWVRRVNGDPDWFGRGGERPLLLGGAAPGEAAPGEESAGAESAGVLPHGRAGGGESPSAGVISGDIVLAGGERRRRLRQETGAGLLTFESWSAAAAVSILGGQCRVLRVITDRGDSEAMADFRRMNQRAFGDLYSTLRKKLKEMS